MTHSKYTVIPSPEIDALLDGALPGIAAAVDALHLPHLAGVVLGGGYGRGEGGVLHTPRGDKLYNDLDFFVFADRASRNELMHIDRELGKVAEAWESRLGVAVDFGPAKNLASLGNVASTLMFQELLHGWRPVWGELDLAGVLPELPPERLPFTEAARLLLNRGMGLLFAANRLLADPGDRDFIIRNLNKALLGGGDALLIADGCYRWNGLERTAELKKRCGGKKLPPGFSEAYEQADRFKIEPQLSPEAATLENWRRCRTFYLSAFAAVVGTSEDAPEAEQCAALREKAKGERSVKNFLRWLIRLRGIRTARRLFDAPVITVLESLHSVLSRENPPRECPENLYRAWQKFN